MPILFAGDYNLRDDAPVFDRLKSHGFRPVLKGKPTTVRRSNGFEKNDYLLHSIDNIFFDAARLRLLEGGIIDFVKHCDSLEAANRISDHVPVWGTVEVIK